MNIKTFEFNEGTVIAEVSEEYTFNAEDETITDTGRFTACLIGGTAPGIKPTILVDEAKQAERVFPSEDAAFQAAYDLALELG